MVVLVRMPLQRLKKQATTNDTNNRGCMKLTNYQKYLPLKSKEEFADSRCWLKEQLVVGACCCHCCSRVGIPAEPKSANLLVWKCECAQALLHFDFLCLVSLHKKYECANVPLCDMLLVLEHIHILWFSNVPIMSLVLEHFRTFAPALCTLGSAGTPAYWKWQWLAMITDHCPHQEEQAESGRQELQWPASRQHHVTIWCEL